MAGLGLAIVQAIAAHGLLGKTAGCTAGPMALLLEEPRPCRPGTASASIDA